MTLEQELTALLTGKTKYLGNVVRWLDEVDSTNLECRRLAEQGAAAGAVVLAREQNAGRGRRGRSFQSEQDLGMYLSVMLRPEADMQTLSNLTAWVAVAVCDGVERCTGVRPQIKWINDIIYLMPVYGITASFKGFNNDINLFTDLPYKGCTIHTKEAWEQLQPQEPTTPDVTDPDDDDDWFWDLFD